jgi:L-lactate dehydrogenase
MECTNGKVQRSSPLNVSNMNAIEPTPMRSTRIAIVGTGNVGATYAYALLLNGVASDIVLIDSNRAKAEGEAMDLNHAVSFAYPTRIWAGDYPDCADAAIIVIAAGVSQRPGETRLDTITRNGEIWKEMIPKIVRYCSSGILLVATNPVDVLTYAAWKLSGLPAARVIGSGTILDTSRFRYLLSEHFGVDARSVHAYIVGEHGDSEVPVWSLANIAGMRLDDFCRTQRVSLDQAKREDIYCQTRDAAYRIIERKGATYYAVAAGLMQITRAILRNQNTVLSVSSLISGYYGLEDVCLSLPTVINRNGVERVLQLELSDQEVEKLRHSADILKATIAKLSF